MVEDSILKNVRKLNEKESPQEEDHDTNGHSTLGKMS
jgi:hypothetical protein